MTVTVIGTGFVGVVTSAVFASFGNSVIGLDVDQKKVDSLRQSQVPFFEPGLEELLKSQQAAGNLNFTTNYQEAISPAEVIMIAVGTPSTPEGGANLQYLLSAVESLAAYLKPGAIVAIKSTVPPGTLEKVEEVIKSKTSVSFFTASLPEFLKEGTAVEDTLHPDRVVIGAKDEQVFATLKELHQPLGAPMLEVTPESAQMAKYAANAYLATRITFINQIADLCEKNRANVQEVIEVIGKDKRIGEHYWYPGMGYGGSCFPKDVKELAHYSRTINESNNLFNKIAELNEARIPAMMDRYGSVVGGWQGKTVAVLGLAFKPNTDDMREAPSTKVIPYLLEHGSTVKGYDPKAIEAAKGVLPQAADLSYYDSIADTCSGADVLMVLIEWPQIVSFDYSTVRTEKQQWLIDVRNQLDPEIMTHLGFRYLSVGRGEYGK